MPRLPQSHEEECHRCKGKGVIASKGKDDPPKFCGLCGGVGRVRVVTDAGFDPKPPLLQDQKAVAHRQSHHVLPKRHEKRVAKELSGRRQPGSGALMGAKGDVRTDGKFPLLVECKRAAGKLTIRLDARHLTKITNEAVQTGRHPALSIQFDESVMDVIASARSWTAAPSDWIAVPLKVFKAMLEQMDE